MGKYLKQNINIMQLLAKTSSSSGIWLPLSLALCFLGRFMAHINQGYCLCPFRLGNARWHRQVGWTPDSSESRESPFWGFCWELLEEHQEVARKWLDLFASRAVIHSWTPYLHSFQGWLCDEMHVRYLMSVRRQSCLGYKSVRGPSQKSKWSEGTLSKSKHLPWQQKWDPTT